MGFRTRKKWDLLSEQSGPLAVLCIAFLAGGGVGCLVAALSGGEGAQELSSYLAGYLALAQTGELPRQLWILMWGQLKFFLTALLLSLTALGVLGMPLLFAVRGFSFTFPIACFCRVFGWRGMFPAFVLFVLPALLWTSALFLVGSPGFLSAQHLLRRSLGEGGGSPPLNGGFWCQAGVCAVLTLAAGLLEYWVVPALLQGVVRLVL